MIDKETKEREKMGYRSSKNELLDLIHADYPFLHVVTDDDVPVIRTLVEIASGQEFLKDSNYDVFTWNISSGFFSEYGEDAKTGFLTKDKQESMEDKVKMLYKTIKEHAGNAIFVLQDFDFVYKEEKNFGFGMKEVIQHIALPINHNQEKLKRHRMTTLFKKHVVVVSATKHIPKELDKLVNVVYFGMPSREEISEIVDIFCKERNLTIPANELEKVITSGIGLTEPEFTNALYKSFITTDGGVNAKEISMIKEQIIKKGGLIEFYTPDIKMNDVGGMLNLMEWVKKREVAFDEEKRIKRKLPYPKGILMTGIPGCGKSHSVKAIANYLEVPLLRLDTGTLMGKYVGESEENTRKAIRLAESVSPAVLWIDEIEKAFPDPRSQNTHEVSNRLLSYFLTWLQEKDSAVFVVATANNIDKLPPELLRKGRFSEIFYVDLPKEEEREQIFKIHLNKIDIDASSMDLTEVIQKSEGFSGAEIEETVQEANFQSAYDDAPLSSEYLLGEVERTTPMSVIMADKIQAIKKWATVNKVRPANK